MRISIPYHRTRLSADVPDENCLGVFEPELPQAAADPVRSVKEAMAAPIGSPRLAELAAGKKNAVIITSDHTRPVPSRFIMPEILAELRRGSPAIDITILVATGFHRATTREELVGKLGEAIVDREKIVIHDSTDRSAMVRLGTLPSGGECLVNRLAVETELLVAEGFIEPHFFAGFSGGRKSVLPGVASCETVLANHCSEFIRSPYARTGNLEDNPIHRDMLYAAGVANLAFIVNVVIDAEKRIVRTFAGHREKAHLAGCEFLRSLAGIRVPEADIVVTGNGGYPLDQNLYQAVKGMTAGEAVCRPGGVIVMVAGCSDGHGGEGFYHGMAGASSPLEVLEKAAKVPRDQTPPDQWEYQILARILASFKVILVTADCDHDMLRQMHLDAARTLEEALAKAFLIAGPQSRVAVIPDGVAVIPEKA